MTDLPSIPAPYIGLTPYTDRNTEIFFGREKDRAIITANLFASRLTILYGPSGVGKSSVLRAGVAVYLHRQSDQIVVVLDDWQTDPATTLKQALVNALRRADPGIEIPSSNLSLAQFIRQSATAARHPLMLLFDQFEDYVLYHPADANSDSFDAELARVVNEEDSPVNVLISIREDALAKLDRFERRIPILFDNYLRLDNLDVDGGRRAIQEPLKVYNPASSATPPYTIEDALIDQVIRQTSPDWTDRPTTTPSMEVEQVQVEAAWLQLIMKRLWDEEVRRNSRVLRLATFKMLGQRKGIIQTHLDDVLGKLRYDQQEVAANLFDHLATPSGMKLALTAEDLAHFVRLPTERVRSVLEILTQPKMRILRAVALPLAQPAQTKYELVNDTLVPAVQGWRDRLQARQSLIERMSMPAMFLVLAVTALTTGAPASLPAPLLGWIRGISLLVLNVVLLLQVARWFYRYVGLTVTSLPVPGLGGHNLGILLGLLLTIFWYVGTVWRQGHLADPGTTLGLLSPQNFIYYLVVLIPTVILGFVCFLLTNGAGAVGYKLFKNYDWGFYIGYFAFCLLLGILIVIMITNPGARGIKFPINP